ncbi:OmpH family outer membrane protein [Marinifilum sp.]|uniref:OmpH family outer membrane protein n=1 Tax=Marinifilum sp. TaxID=2033137 RepID=UPI003BA9C196
MRIKILLFVFILNVFGFAVQAQTDTKIGYANVEFIVSKMPEVNTIETELEAANAELKTQLDGMLGEYQRKVQAYEQSVDGMLEAVRKEKEIELTQLQQRIQKFQADAQNSLQQKQAELMNPLFVKIKTAIQELAKEEGFNLILNGQLGGAEIVLFSDDQTDVSDKVLKKLGVY